MSAWDLIMSHTSCRLMLIVTRAGSWAKLQEEVLQFHDHDYRLWNIPQSLLGMKSFQGPFVSGEVLVRIVTTSVGYPAEIIASEYSEDAMLPPTAPYKFI